LNFFLPNPLEPEGHRPALGRGRSATPGLDLRALVLRAWGQRRAGFRPRGGEGGPK
jgi:hypothetical protein